MGNIIFRVKDEQKASYERSALSEGLSLSDWLKDMADERSGYLREKQVPIKRGTDVIVVPLKKKIANVKKKQSGVVESEIIPGTSSSKGDKEWAKKVSAFHKASCDCNACEILKK
jgi:NAD(P)H-nitrite reductase large subunit